MVIFCENVDEDVEGAKMSVLAMRRMYIALLWLTCQMLLSTAGFHKSEIPTEL